MCQRRHALKGVDVMHDNMLIRVFSARDYEARLKHASIAWFELAALEGFMLRSARRAGYRTKRIMQLPNRATETMAQSFSYSQPTRVLGRWM